MWGGHFHVAPFTQPVKDGKAARLFGLDAVTKSNCRLCKNIDKTGQDTHCHIPCCVTYHASFASETVLSKITDWGVGLLCLVQCKKKKGNHQIRGLVCGSFVRSLCKKGFCCNPNYNKELISVRVTLRGFRQIQKTKHKQVAPEIVSSNVINF